MKAYTIKEAAALAGMSVNALRELVPAAARRPTADIQLPRLGTCIIHLTTKNYLIIPLMQVVDDDDDAGDNSPDAAAVKAEILSILKEQLKYVCEDCAENVINKMIENIEHSE